MADVKIPFLGLADLQVASGFVLAYALDLIERGDELDDRNFQDPPLDSPEMKLTAKIFEYLALAVDRNMTAKISKDGAAGCE